MNKFLIQSLFFILIPTVWFGFNYLLNHYKYSHQNISLKTDQLLIIGDSHPLMGLNPEKFVSAENIAQFAEPYVITFWKLKKMLVSTKLDSVIIGFAPHNISAFNDYKFSDEKWSYEMFRRSYQIGNLASIEDKIPIDYFTYFKVIFKENCLYPKKNNVHYIGKYNNSKLSNVSNWNDVINLHYYKDSIQLGVSEVSKSFLDSIVNICKQNSINLTFVNPPIHTNYLKHIPKNIITEYDFLKKKYDDSDILIIDKGEDIYPDSFFLDADHLNSYGADRFTNEVKELLTVTVQKSLK